MIFSIRRDIVNSRAFKKISDIFHSLSPIQRRAVVLSIILLALICLAYVMALICLRCHLSDHFALKAQLEGESGKGSYTLYDYEKTKNTQNTQENKDTRSVLQKAGNVNTAYVAVQGKTEKRLMNIILYNECGRGKIVAYPSSHGDTLVYGGVIENLVLLGLLSPVIQSISQNVSENKEFVVFENRHVYRYDPKKGTTDIKKYNSGDYIGSFFDNQPVRDIVHDALSTDSTLSVASFNHLRRSLCVGNLGVPFVLGAQTARDLRLCLKSCAQQMYDNESSCDKVDLFTKVMAQCCVANLFSLKDLGYIMSCSDNRDKNIPTHGQISSTVYDATIYKALTLGGSLVEDVEVV